MINDILGVLTIAAIFGCVLFWREEGRKMRREIDKAIKEEKNERNK